MNKQQYCFRFSIESCLRYRDSEDKHFPNEKRKTLRIDDYYCILGELSNTEKIVLESSFFDWFDTDENVKHLKNTGVADMRLSFDVAPVGGPDEKRTAKILFSDHEYRVECERQGTHLSEMLESPYRVLSVADSIAQAILLTRLNQQESGETPVHDDDDTVEGIRQDPEKETVEENGAHDNEKSNKLCKNGRPSKKRNEWFVDIHEKEGVTPAIIRDKWNNLSIEERKRIDPDNTGIFLDQKKGLQCVEMAIKRYKRKKQGKA